MNKLYLTLILGVTSVLAYSWYGDTHSTHTVAYAYGDTYRDLYSHGRGGASLAKKSGSDIACANAVAGFNRGISQLALDTKNQVNQWIIYSDLDALDELSYYLTHTCEKLSLELVIEQSSEQTQVQHKACKNFFGIINAILEQDETRAFRGGYERGNELSEAALDAGRDLGDGCAIGLRPVEEQEARPTEDQEAESEEESDLAEENYESGEAEADLDEWSYFIFSSRNSANGYNNNGFDWKSYANNNSDDDNDSEDSDDNDYNSDDDSEDESDNSDDDSDDDSDNDDDSNDDGNSDSEDDSDDNSDDDSEDDSDDNSDDNSDDDSDEDSDDDDDDDNSNVSWSYDSNKGVRVKVSKESNGQEDDYTISYNPKDGFSMQHSVTDDENADQEANNEEWSLEEWNNDADDQEWNNDEPLDIKEEIQRQKSYLSMIARYYDRW